MRAVGHASSKWLTGPEPRVVSGVGFVVWRQLVTSDMAVFGVVGDELIAGFYLQSGITGCIIVWIILIGSTQCNTLALQFRPGMGG